MFDILCVFTASFLGAFSAFLFSLMKEQQSEKQADREEKLCALKYEQPVPLTVENLIALREALPPYADMVWCLGYNEHKHLVTLQQGDGQYALQVADGTLLGGPFVMVQLSLPGHEVSIAYTPPGTKKAVNADLWVDEPDSDIINVKDIVSGTLDTSGIVILEEETE